MKTKRVLLLLVLLPVLLWLGLRTYWQMQPKVILTNASQVAIGSATVLLPSNRLSFDALAPGASQEISYDADQQPGQYRYQLTLANGLELQGRCAKVVDGELGKRQQIILAPDLSIQCQLAP